MHGGKQLKYFLLVSIIDIRGQGRCKAYAKTRFATIKCVNELFGNRKGKGEKSRVVDK
jgi:hypothetical protein